MEHRPIDLALTEAYGKICRSLMTERHTGAVFEASHFLGKLDQVIETIRIVNLTAQPFSCVRRID